jgi:hypothetical protein
VTPGSEYLLVEVSEADAEVEAALARMPGVRGVTVHGNGCCCGNCPWNGDHRTHAERRDGTPLAPPS